MRVLNKQKLEKEIKQLFEQYFGGSSKAEEHAHFNQELDKVLEQKEQTILEAEQYTASVLFADLRGFTSLVENQSASNVITILNTFFGTMVDIIDRHGGTVDKFMGDSIFAFFRMGDNARDSVLKVLQCAIEMQIAMDNVNKKGGELGLDTLYMGIGINTGEIVASVLGSDIYREYTVIGADVNLASRIEAYTLRGQILLSENTRQIAGDAIITSRMNEVNAKGMREPLRFYSLLGVDQPQPLLLPVRENRKAPRVQISLPVSYQLLEGKNVLPEIYEGQVVDMSYGGMSINASAPISQFADIKIRITLAPFTQGAVDLYAKALYVQAGSGEGEGAEVGLEFTIIDDATSATVKDFVDNLI